MHSLAHLVQPPFELCALLDSPSLHAVQCTVTAVPGRKCSNTLDNSVSHCRNGIFLAVAVQLLATLKMYMALPEVLGILLFLQNMISTKMTTVDTDSSC